MADTAIRGNIWDQHVLTALRALNVPLTAPDTPLAHRLFGSGAPQQYGARDAQVRADKAFQPLRRALHNDRAKIHALTQNASEKKLTDLQKSRKRPQQENDTSTTAPEPAPQLVTSADICIRNLFRQADPVAFKLPYTRKPFPRDHNPPLRNGKLDEADKKALRANLHLMEGKFAALALQQLDTLF